MGGSGSSSGKGGGAGGASRSVISSAKSNPSSAPIGTKLTMGGYKYTKTGSNTWRTYNPSGKRISNRKDADIKRVFA